MESITVTLSAGSITLQVDADFLSMDPDDFAFVTGLARAMRARVADVEPDGDEPDEPAPDEVDDPDPMAWECERCRERFKTPQGLGAHRRHRVCGPAPAAIEPAAAVQRAVDLAGVVEAALDCPYGVPVWRHVASTLDLTEASARSMVIEAKRAGLIPRTDRDVWANAAP